MSAENTFLAQDWLKFLNDSAEHLLNKCSAETFSKKNFGGVRGEAPQQKGRYYEKDCS